MKKFIIVCLLAAIGTVGLIAKGDARSIREFCMQNPDLPDCAPYMQGGRPSPVLPPSSSQTNDTQGGRPTPMLPPPSNQNDAFGQPIPQQPDQPPFGQRRDWRHRNGFGFQFGFGAPVANRCMEFSLRLREQGWRNVRAVRCAGQSYIYSAWRDGQPLTLMVSPNSGRIRRILPAY